MIISCPNCDKKFNLHEKLIPKNGRLLQCSSCNHKWHYRIPNKENVIFDNDDLSKRNKNISINGDKKISIKPSLIEKTIDSQKIKKNNKPNKSLDIKNKYIGKNFSLVNILYNLIIIFITFSALIIILDTFKNNISNYFPIVFSLLDNLYLSFSDLYSFIKDLLN